MVFTYNELLKKYKYQIDLALKKNEIYEVEKVIYSDKKMLIQWLYILKNILMLLLLLKIIVKYAKKIKQYYESKKI